MIMFITINGCISELFKKYAVLNQHVYCINGIPFVSV